MIIPPTRSFGPFQPDLMYRSVIRGGFPMRISSRAPLESESLSQEIYGSTPVVARLPSPIKTQESSFVIYRIGADRTTWHHFEVSYMAPRRDPPVSVRIEKDTLTRIKAAAQLEGKTVSGFIKDAAAEAADRRIRREAEEAENRRTGLSVDKGRPGLVGRLFGQNRHPDD